MNFRSILAPAVALLALSSVTASHAAQSCSLNDVDNPFDDTCTLDLSTVTISYSVTSTYGAIEGEGGWSPSNAWLLPPLSEIDSGARAGFAFNPGLDVKVASLAPGLGRNAGFGSFTLGSLVIAAKAGYKIDSIEFGVRGFSATSGDASVTWRLPGAPVFSSGNFDSMAFLPANTALFGAGFDLDVGDDAWARGSIDSVRLVADVSAVPEPETVALLLAGLPLVALARRRRA